MAMIINKMIENKQEQPALRISKKPSPLPLKMRPITKSNKIKPMISIIENLFTFY